MDKEKTVMEQDDSENGGLVSSVFDWVSAAVIAMVVVTLLFSLFFRVVNVSGDSMTDTLQSGEKLILTGVCAVPEYGDVVVIRRVNDSPLIKRVIGLPGDKIFINDETGIVYRNGEALDEPYVRGGFTPSMGLSTAYVVPEDGIFVLGDNRPESLDSRMLRDNIKMKDVVGVVTFRLSPFESLRGE